MFKHTKILPMLALLLTTSVASTAFAKVPYRAGEKRSQTSTAVANDTSNRSAVMGRFGRIAKVAKAEPRKECTHTHRYSWQHWM